MRGRTVTGTVRSVASDRLGMRRGRRYPASAASHLLNPLRNLVQPPGRIVARMGLRHEHHVLEVGCGPGWFSPAIADAVPGGRLVLCDAQPAMLAIAAARTAARANVVTVPANATELPFTDASFDGVLLSSVLGEVGDRRRCLLEVRRVLRPSGAVTVVETRRDSDFVTRAEIADLANATGLVVARMWGTRWEYTARLRPSSVAP